MKITIATSGRFHVADLARELIRCGHDVVFHSIVPPGRLEQFGVPRRNQKCHLAAVAPLVAGARRMPGPRRWREAFNRSMQRALDSRYARIKEPGDVFIGMSGLCVRSLREAKARGARVLLERGSRHIRSQKEILDALASGQQSEVSTWTVERELRGYEESDTIVVPSVHVENSFLERDVPAGRLFRNPYGVDLEGFPPTTLEAKSFDVIMVGIWGRRKGCDLLAQEILERSNLSLLHVGTVGDLPLPQHERFQHVDPVPQGRLPEFYARAKVFALPSQEEGLSLVQAQALSCGLPVVGSARSGVEDLAQLSGLDAPVLQAVTPELDGGLRESVARALEFSASMPAGPRDLLGDRRNDLSWSEYGKRYDEFLRSL